MPQLDFSSQAAELLRLFFLYLSWKTADGEEFHFVSINCTAKLLTDDEDDQEDDDDDDDGRSEIQWSN